MSHVILIIITIYITNLIFLILFLIFFGSMIYGKSNSEVSLKSFSLVAVYANM